MNRRGIPHAEVVEAYWCWLVQFTMSLVSVMWVPVYTIHDLQGTTLDLPRFHGFPALNYMFARKAQFALLSIDHVQGQVRWTCIFQQLTLWWSVQRAPWAVTIYQFCSVWTSMYFTVHLGTDWQVDLPSYNIAHITISRTMRYIQKLSFVVYR